MPVTVTAPRGVLTAQGEREIVPQLIAALIDASGLTGNTFFTPIVGGTFHLLDPRDIYAGGINRPVIMVELKLPDIGLPTAQARAAFIAEATRVVSALTALPHDPENIWVNILNAPDSGWGIAGKAWSGPDLVAAVTAAAQAVTAS
jgi:phenylpyruvate tautomerase PptA (4-oxalocrotonate tautomerase family)